MEHLVRFFSRFSTRVILGVFSILVLTAFPLAQEEWKWPDRAQNLQILPKDFSGQRIRAVMTGFTRALGVRCSHCHVGEEGAPLSTYDFPSDADPQKTTARAMLKMLGAVNDHLDKIEPTGPQRVNMWCHTCHRGQPRPVTLADALREKYQAEGIGATVALYRDLRERYYGSGSYDFSESNLNSMGYFLMESGKTDDAIELFRLNAEFHPKSANAFDSLAEGYLKSGRIELAIAYYQKSLQLNPENSNAVEKLKELRNR